LGDDLNVQGGAHRLDGVATDGFSNELSISGDDNTVVVGSAFATVSGQTDAGSVYIFVKPSGGWTTATETAKLTEPHPTAYDDFCCVSVSSDGTTVFVGTLQYDFTNNTPTGPGEAYIFLRPASGWATTKNDSKKQAEPKMAQLFFLVLSRFRVRQ